MPLLPEAALGTETRLRSSADRYNAAMPREHRIDSAQNDRIKRLVRLRSRRERDSNGLFLIEGARETGRALEAGVAVRELYLCPERFSDEAWLLHDGLEHSEATTRFLVAPEAFDKASLREHPDGVLAVAESWRSDPAAVELPSAALVLVLDGLEKPGNLGALLRTADAAAVDAVFVTGAGTDIFNPNVVRASMGSLFGRPVLTTDPETTRSQLARSGLQLIAATPTAETAYWDVSYLAATAIVVGSEHDGLAPAWFEQAAAHVVIPMAGLADSLNAATAGALLLYEARRQRRIAAG